MIQSIIEAIAEKKGEHITSIDLRQIENASADYYLICEAQSRTQVCAIADGIERQVFQSQKQWPRTTEGTQVGEWVLLDYGTVLVHIFQSEVRSRYRLEDLWGDGIINNINEELISPQK